jgi:excinuclease ABC subunit B
MFRLNAPFTITGEQEKAVESIKNKFDKNHKKQVLLGVTGSGKTFVMANVIRELAVPTLVISPNKTLAAQLFQEFKAFFPQNRVGYFISYYDYYQPEAFVPQRNQYIAKEVSINPELERLRIDAARNLLETPFTVIVASVSAIYSIGSPDDFFEQKISLHQGNHAQRDFLISEFITLGYRRSETFIESGLFRVRGFFLEIFPTSEENPVRITLANDLISSLEIFDPINGETQTILQSFNIYPISYFHYKKKRILECSARIRHDLDQQILYFKEIGKPDYAERIKERTLYDLELLENVGYCSGIENYSLYLTNRQPGEAPYTLLNFFKHNFLTIIDESHITLPQLKGMYEGDQSRKRNLVEFGFRLPSALDNRPLNYQEINSCLDKVLYVSATPKDLELTEANGCQTELLVRPTGLLDPVLEIRRETEPVKDLIKEVKQETSAGNRVLITTLTKRMAEKLADYLSLQSIRCTYMHSDIKTLDRIKIIQKLRRGDVDVLIGINLLREGLDLPEVSLVIILDADQEGFLRSDTALIQTFGRAARHENGRVILYIQQITGSLKRAIDESMRRRAYQEEFNRIHQITPKSIQKSITSFSHNYNLQFESGQDWQPSFKNEADLRKQIDQLNKQMKKKAQLLDFKEAAQLRDRLIKLKNILIEIL